MEPLTGLDAAFLALETQTSRLHVAGVLVLGPPAVGDAGEALDGVPPDDASTRTFTAIRRVIEQRLERVPRLRQRAVRAPLGLQRPVWVDDPDLDLDMHVRRASLPPPGGQRELEALVGEVMSRPFDRDRPLWEMVVVDGLAGGRSAVVARLHHAILDGEAGATAMAAFLDLEAGGDTSGSGTDAPGGASSEASAPSGVAPPPREPVPSTASMWRYTAGGLLRQSEEAIDALQRSIDTMIELAAQNRQLALEEQAPPPAPFRAPRTSLNGNVTGERRFKTLRVPVEDLEIARGASGDGGLRPTLNDVILCAVGGALMRYLDARGETPSSSIVALVPVSTRRRRVPAPGQPATVGNDVSGMLVPLATTTADPAARLAAVALATTVAKAQEERAGGDFLETVVRALSPVVLSTFMRGAGALRFFDRVPPPFNVVVSSVVVPDVSLWWAGRPVVDVYPVGPVADGFGLNVTAMTYRGSVHFGLLASPRLVADLEEIAVLLDDAVAELVLAGLGPPEGLGGRPRPGGFTSPGGAR